MKYLNKTTLSILAMLCTVHNAQAVLTKESAKSLATLFRKLENQFYQKLAEVNPEASGHLMSEIKSDEEIEQEVQKAFADDEPSTPESSASSAAASSSWAQEQQAAPTVQPATTSTSLDRLTQAIRNGDVASVISAVQDNPDLIQTFDAMGLTPLHWIAMIQKNKYKTESHPIIADILIQQTKNLNQTSKNEAAMTPLHIAIMQGNDALVTKLIDHGADVSIQDGHRQSTYQHAKQAQQDPEGMIGDTQEVIGLVERAYVRQLQKQIDDANIATAIKLIRQKPDLVHEKDNVDRTPLHYIATREVDNQKNAVRSGIASFLISEGAHINETDQEGLTPLMHAAMRGNHELVARLLSKGAGQDKDMLVELATILAPQQEADENIKKVIDLLVEAL